MVGVFVVALAGATFAADSTPAPVPAPIVIEGTITAVAVAGPASGKITVQQPAPCPTCPIKAPVTFLVTDKTQLFKDGNPCKLADIRVGDGCRATLVQTAAGLTAQMVYATTGTPPVKTVNGTIVEKALSSAYGRTFKLAVPGTGSSATVLMWFSVSNTTKITLDGNPATYDRLAVGQSAEVGFVPPPPSMLPVVQPIPALTVAAKSAPPPVVSLVGKLVGLDLTNGIIRVLPLDANCTDPGKCAVAFRVIDSTKIDKFGPAKLAALMIGDTLNVTYQAVPAGSAVSPVALSVIVLPETFVGVVDKVVVDPAGVGGVLYVRQLVTTAPIVAPIPFKVVAETRITRNGQPAKLVQLLRGDAASVKFFLFGSEKVAALVEAKGPTPIVTP